MRTEKIRKGFQVTKLELFESIHELDAIRNHEAHCLFLEDWGIGSDMVSIGNHFNELFKYVTAGKQKETWQECKNLHNNLFNMVERINTRSLCFTPFIHSINSKEVFPDFKKQYSLDKSRELLDDLAKKGLNQSHVTDILEDIKKNFKANLVPTFLTDLEMEELPMYSPNSNSKS